MPDPRKNKISCKTYISETEVGIEVISGKWKSTILMHLQEEGKIRFNQFLRILPDITQKMLTQQLKVLERDNLVNRKSFDTVPPVVEYSLTPIGKKAIPILKELNKLGKKVIKEFNSEKKQ